MANKPLAAASPCHRMAPRAASPQPPRSKTGTKPVPGSASFPASLLLPFPLGSPDVALAGRLFQSITPCFRGRIWGFWVEAAASELPSAELLPAPGLNHLFLGLLAKRDGFSTQPSRRSRCHFRMAFDHQSVKPSPISQAVSIFAFNPFQLVPGVGSAGHHLLLVSFPQTLQVEL